MNSRATKQINKTDSMKEFWFFKLVKNDFPFLESVRSSAIPEYKN